MHKISGSSGRHPRHTSALHVDGACYCVRMCLKRLPASLPLTVYSYGMKQSRYDNSGILGRVESSYCASRTSPVCRTRDPRSRPRSPRTGHNPSRRRNTRTRRCGTPLHTYMPWSLLAQKLSGPPTLEPQERLQDTPPLPQEQGPSNVRLISLSLHSPSVSFRLHPPFRHAFQCGHFSEDRNVGSLQFCRPSIIPIFQCSTIPPPCHVLYMSRASPGRFRGPSPSRGRGWRIRNDGEASGKTSPAARHSAFPSHSEDAR